MNKIAKKMQRLTKVAHLYYMQGQNQDKIAKDMEVSRPLVSRLLKEARDLGIVEIKINTVMENTSSINARLIDNFGVQLSSIIPENENDVETSKQIAIQLKALLSSKKEKMLGIGWGAIIGEMVQLESDEVWPIARGICPLIGNSSVSNKNYHSNELVRMLSDKAGAKPTYLHGPAFAETYQEMNNFKSTESFMKLEKSWATMTVAVVNIGNYPSSPDFGTAARFGSVLSKNAAVGNLLSYFYNIQGQIINSETDYAIQVPISTLKNCKKVVGVCSANVTSQCLLGALRTGLLTHVICSENALLEVLAEEEKK